MNQAKRILNTDIVVTKAAEIADDIGLERLTMSMLADQLNVRPPSIYNHVKNLEDLYNQLTLKGLKELQTSVEKSMENTRKNQLVSATSHALRDFAKQKPTLFLCACKNFSMSDSEYEQATAPLLASIDEIFARIEPNREKALLVSLFLRCLLNGFISLEAHNALAPADDADALFDKLIKLANTVIKP